MKKVKIGAGFDGGELQLAFKVSPTEYASAVLSNCNIGPLSGKSVKITQNIVSIKALELL